MPDSADHSSTICCRPGCWLESQMLMVREPPDEPEPEPEPSEPLDVDADEEPPPQAASESVMTADSKRAAAFFIFINYPPFLYPEPYQISQNV